MRAQNRQAADDDLIGMFGFEASSVQQQTNFFLTQVRSSFAPKNRMVNSVSAPPSIPDRLELLPECHLRLHAMQIATAKYKLSSKENRAPSDPLELALLK
jgi:hypothetical protein